jgi:uncharacterized membrane protein YkvA (DUF1232 family)
MSLIKQWRQRAGQIKVETYAIYLAYRDPRTPWYAKLLVAGVIAYAVSPIDLIPDFIPVLGVLDDLIIVPLGIALSLKMIPQEVMTECREKARDAIELNVSGGTKLLVSAAIITTWCLLVALVVLLVLRL